jgi:hypothetical protein
MVAPDPVYLISCNNTNNELFPERKSSLTVLRFRDVYPESRILIFPTRVQGQMVQYRLTKNFKERCFLFLSSRKYDPGCLSRIRKISIPDTGVKRTLVHGSRNHAFRTLFYTFLFLLSILVISIKSTEVVFGTRTERFNIAHNTYFTDTRIEEMYKLPSYTSKTAYLNVSVGHVWNLEGNIALGSEYHVTLLCIVNVCLGHLQVAKTTK